MKKIHFNSFIIISILLGIIGAAARTSQLRYCFDPETGMLKAGSGATVLLFIVGFLALALCVAAVVILRKSESYSIKKTNLSAFTPFAFFTSSLLMFIYSAVLLISIFNHPLPQVNIDFTKLILAFLSIYSAVSLLVIGKYRMEERNSTVYSIFSAVPVFWACFMLILTFRDKIADPIIADYVTLILSCISILFVAYSIAAHLLGKDKKYTAVFSCGLGLVFILTELISSVIVNGISFADSAKMLEFLSQLAFVILIPFSTEKILRK